MCLLPPQPNHQSRTHLRPKCLRLSQSIALRRPFDRNKPRVIEPIRTVPSVPPPSTAEPSESDTPAAEVPASLAEHTPETPVETGLRHDGGGVEGAHTSKPV